MSTHHYCFNGKLETLLYIDRSAQLLKVLGTTRLKILNSRTYKYIYHSMRYLFGIYKELIKCGLQRNIYKIVLYRSIYGISSELDITRIYMNMLNKAYLTSWISYFTS